MNSTLWHDTVCHLLTCVSLVHVTLTVTCASACHIKISLQALCVRDTGVSTQTPKFRELSVSADLQLFNLHINSLCVPLAVRNRKQAVGRNRKPPLETSVWFQAGAGTFSLLYRTQSEGLHSSVGIATCYGPDGPKFESRWGQDFPQPSRPALQPTHPPIQWLPGMSWW